MAAGIQDVAVRLARVESEIYDAKAQLKSARADEDKTYLQGQITALQGQITALQQQMVIWMRRQDGGEHTLPHFTLTEDSVVRVHIAVCEFAPLQHTRELGTGNGPAETTHTRPVQRVSFFVSVERPIRADYLTRFRRGANAVQLSSERWASAVSAEQGTSTPGACARMHCARPTHRHRRTRGVLFQRSSL